MKILLVDDEPLALRRLTRMLTDHPLVTQLLISVSGYEALRICDEEKPDAVVLDIEMPGLSGLDVAKQLRTEKSSPCIVFLTAHPEHALESYEYAAIDYLLKPVSSDRLDEALNRINQHLVLASSKPAIIESFDRHLCVTIGSRLLRISFSDVVCCIAEDKYVRLVHNEGEAILSQSLTQLELEYPNIFLRIHRHTLVNPKRILSLETTHGQHYLLLDGMDMKLEVSRRRVADVRQYLKG